MAHGHPYKKCGYQQVVHENWSLDEDGGTLIRPGYAIPLTACRGGFEYREEDIPYVEELESPDHGGGPHEGQH